MDWSNVISHGLLSAQYNVILAFRKRLNGYASRTKMLKLVDDRKQNVKIQDQPWTL